MMLGMVHLHKRGTAQPRWSPWIVASHLSQDLAWLSDQSRVAGVSNSWLIVPSFPISMNTKLVRSITALINSLYLPQLLNASVATQWRLILRTTMNTHMRFGDHHINVRIQT
jgi:hypothetical protein